MTCALYSTTEVCGATAGIKALIFTDMTNVENYGPGFLPAYPLFDDAEQVFAIAFERFSGEYSQDSQSNQGGDYAISRAEVFVPRSRSEIDTLLNRMRNRYLMVIAIDRYNNQHILYNARRTFRHATGSKPGNRHGYQITFTSPNDYLRPAISGNGEIETAPPGPVSGDPGAGDGCCITINPVGIDYTPAPSGNALNRNEMVVTTNGSVYFIDNNGLSLLLNRPAPQYYDVQIEPGTPPTSVILPSWFWIPDPGDYPSPTYDPQAEISIRLWAKVATRWIPYDHTDGWTLDYATRTVTFAGPLDEAYIEFYSFQGIPPTPL